MLRYVLPCAALVIFAAACTQEPGVQEPTGAGNGTETVTLTVTGMT